MGFKPQGINLPLIMIDPNDKDGRYLVETRLDKLVEELHVNKIQIKGMDPLERIDDYALHCHVCVLSVPYIFLTVKEHLLAQLPSMTSLLDPLSIALEPDTIRFQI
jgi:hypothetical protein